MLVTFKDLIDNPRNLDKLSRKQAIKFIRDYLVEHSEKAILRVLELEEENERLRQGITLRKRR